MAEKKHLGKTKKETKHPKAHDKEHKKELHKEAHKEVPKEDHKEAITSERPENKLILERLKKLDEIRNNGINPYPYKYDISKAIGQIREENKNLPSQTNTGKKESVAGRIMLLRDMGRLAFITIMDDLETIQLMLREDKLGEKIKLLKLLDIGDFIGVKGEVITTRTGELSISVEELTILAKSLRPMPEKFHGIQDTEIKYRKRYLDLITNKESAETFRKKVLLFRAIREFLDNKGFMEVETPTLQPLYGGAAARPFTTTHNELKMKLYLKISDELYLKRLIIGGFSKVYEIDKDFRNEGIDTTHNPEFTMLEAYWAYADFNDMMKLTEEMYEYVALKVNGTTKSNYKGNEIDFKAPWKRITMLDAIQKYAGIDAAKMTEKELAAFMKKNNVEFDKEPCWGNYVMTIFEHYCEDKFIQPTFIIDYPKESTPLCKSHKTDDRLIERFEPFCCGMELANAYSELNDPNVQRKLLEDQARQLKAGNDEANPMDEEFIEAMEHGMPPTGGLGIGIDRMAMLILGKESIRDVILFPTMKPEEGKGK